MQQQINAYQKYIRQSPRKMRLVADMVRGMRVDQALVQLELSSKKAAEVVLKVIKQAQANAVNNAQLAPDSLKVSTIIIEEGPTFKRWQPVSRGRAHPILKRTSHIKVTVTGKDQEVTKPEPVKKKKGNK